MVKNTLSSTKAMLLLFMSEYQQIYDSKVAELQEKRRKAKEQAEIDKMPWHKWTDFYCKKCDEDMRLIGDKGYTSYKGGRWFYRAKCEKCNSELIRRITEKKFDPYFIESKRLRTDRKRYWKELLQRDDPRFKKIYGDHELAAERERENELRTNFDNK